MDEVSAIPVETVAKYQKVLTHEGYIISAYYTSVQEEKLQEFTAVCVNLGNPTHVKELIGVRKNTKFVNLSKKTMNKQPNYLVLSFENRKKSNNRLIEYPITRLDMIIKALQELK